MKTDFCIYLTNCLQTKKLSFGQQKRYCKARVHIVNHEVVISIDMHNHEPSAAKVAADKIVTKIKKRALETQESTCQVINECTQNTDVACQGALPNQQALKKLIRRNRNEINQGPSKTTTLADLEIPEFYKMYESEPNTLKTFCLLIVVRVLKES
jgi:hypothetical protein